MFADSIRSASEALSPRATVELGGAASGDGTYRDVTKWHKVRRGETLGAIASRYGVTTRQVKRWNGLKSSKVRRGTKLKIVTREFVPAPRKQQTDVSPAITDTTPVQAIDTVMAATLDSIAARMPVEITEPQPKAEEPKPAPKPKAKTATTHKVAKGDTLYSLSKRYGVSVERIREANNMSDNNLAVGRRLKIPAK